MLLNVGTQEQLIAETTLGAGSTVVYGSTRSDAILVSLWVDSISSGDIQLEIYTLTEEGKEVSIISFPAVAVGTTELLLRKSAVTLQNFHVVATYTGILQYEVYVRAIESSGESSSKILGSSNWSVSQASVPTSATLLIPSSLTDRNGLVLKNWSTTSTVYLAESSTGATIATGYPLAPRDALALDVAAGAAVWAVSDMGTADMRIAQSGG